MNNIKEDVKEKKQNPPVLQHNPFILWTLKKKSPLGFVGKENVFEVSPQ